jgi:hypothetical protein
LTASPSSVAPFGLRLEDFLYRWERGLSIPIHTALFRRSAFGPGSAFVDGQRQGGLALLVGLALRGVPLGYLPPVLCYRIHEHDPVVVGHGPSG